MMISIILKVILWVVALILSFVFLLLIYPIWYKAKIRIGSLSYETLHFDIRMRLLSFVLASELIKDESGVRANLKLFGIRLRKRSKDGEKDDKEGSSERKETKLFQKEKKHELRADTTNTEPEYEEEDCFLVKIFYKIKRKTELVLAKYRKIKEKKELYRKLLDTESCKRALLKGKTEGYRIIKHILPTGAKGHLRMGFDSCDRTGMIFGYYSVLNGYLLYDLNVYPDFENEVFEGEAVITGRIIPIYLVWRVLKLILNKDVRLTYKRFNKIKRR